jgi:multicomponent Na+:H+ antiporter subunit F
VTVVGVLAFTLLTVGALLALVRLARGPSLLDRVVAMDALLVIVVMGLGVYAGVTGDTTVVPVLLVVSLLGYIGAVAVARYVGGIQLRSSSEERRR